MFCAMQQHIYIFVWGKTLHLIMILSILENEMTRILETITFTPPLQISVERKL